MEPRSPNLNFEEKKGSLFHLYKQGKLDARLTTTDEQKTKSFDVASKLSNNFDQFADIAGSNEPSTSSNTGSSVASSSNLLVNQRQTGNPILQLIRSVRWEYAEIEPDFVMGRNLCALFLSLKYHNTKPNYIYNRVSEMKPLYDLRVLLILVDSADSIQVIRDLSKLCITNNFTMLLAWSHEEVARYLESFKTFEHKPPDILIGEKVKGDGFEIKSAEEEEIRGLVGFLSSIASINKTDARTLIETFGTIEAIMLADYNQLKSCPGLGALKAKSLYELFRKPIMKNNKDDT